MVPQTDKQSGCSLRYRSIFADETSVCRTWTADPLPFLARSFLFLQIASHSTFLMFFLSIFHFLKRSLYCFSLMWVSYRSLVLGENAYDASIPYSSIIICLILDTVLSWYSVDIFSRCKSQSFAVNFRGSTSMMQGELTTEDEFSQRQAK